MTDDEIEMEKLTEMLRSASKERKRLTQEIKETVTMHKKNGKLLSDMYAYSTEEISHLSSEPNEKDSYTAKI